MLLGNGDEKQDLCHRTTIHTTDNILQTKRRRMHQDVEANEVTAASQRLSTEKLEPLRPRPSSSSASLQVRVSTSKKSKTMAHDIGHIPNQGAVSPMLSRADGTVVADPAILDMASHLLNDQMAQVGSNKTYVDARQALLADEREVRWDEPARRRASASELRAQEIVFTIREHERKFLFGDLPTEAIPGPDTRDMGGHFLRNKNKIAQSKIFEIAKELPKGSHLHLHFNSEIQPELLLPHARSLTKTFRIRSTIPLIDDKDFGNAEIVFNILPADTEHADLFSPSYNPDWKPPGNLKGPSWMLWEEFRERFPRHIDVPSTPENDIDHDLDRAERWARAKMVVNPDGAYDATNTHNGAWACFNIGTRAFKGLVGYEGVYRWYIGQAIESMIKDKVMYAELRPMLLDKTLPSDDGLRQLDHNAQMNIICEEIQKTRSKLEDEGRLNEFPFGMKIIYSAPRSIPRPMMQKELNDCIRLKLQHPDLICGFDLVGAEDRPNSISTYADLLVAFTKTCTELNIKIPFMFHAGETLLDTGGSADPQNSNLYDAVLLEAERIGHGYALLKHPLLIERYKKKNICLELCPISNELLHLCGNAREHPFPALLAAGLHCTLNADNPSLFSSRNGVSNTVVSARRRRKWPWRFTSKRLKGSVRGWWRPTVNMQRGSSIHDEGVLNSNLYDAVLLEAERIGHGYALLKHPLLIERYKKKNICLELCPISNELLHLCGNAREHPFPALLAAGLHCTLNADNPSLFRGSSKYSSSLSHEFYQVMVGDTRMTVHGWKQLAEWSIEHSCISQTEKEMAMAIYQQAFERPPTSNERHYITPDAEQQVCNHFLTVTTAEGVGGLSDSFPDLVFLEKHSVMFEAFGSGLTDPLASGDPRTRTMQSSFAIVLILVLILFSAGFTWFAVRRCVIRNLAAASAATASRSSVPDLEQAALPPMNDDGVALPSNHAMGFSQVLHRESLGTSNRPMRACICFNSNVRYSSPAQILWPPGSGCQLEKTLIHELNARGVDMSGRRHEC
nr:adenosine deaminase cecr1 [Quercus suber]